MIDLGLKISTLSELATILEIPYQSAIRTIVPRFHGSLIPSRTIVKFLSKFLGGKILGISTTIIPSLLVESEEIFLSSS